MFGLSRGSRGSKDNLTLSDIIRGLQYCVNASQDIAEWHHVTSLRRFFVNYPLDEHGNEDKSNPIPESELHMPVRQRLKLAPDVAVDVPLFTLADHSSLVLDEMEVALSLFVKNADFKQDAASFSKSDSDSANGTVDRVSFDVELMNVKPRRGGTHMDIKLKFKQTNPPEEISRIVDKLNDMVRAYSLKDKDGNAVTNK